MTKVNLTKTIELTHKLTNVWNGVEFMEMMDVHGDNGRLIVKIRRADENGKPQVDVEVLNPITLEVLETMEFGVMFVRKDVEIIINKINQAIKTK